MRDKAKPVEQLVPLNVLGSSCRIAGHHHDGGNDANGEGAQDDIDQVQAAGDSCQLAWRNAPNGLHQSSPTTRVDAVADCPDPSETLRLVIAMTRINLLERSPAVRGCEIAFQVPPQGSVGGSDRSR